MPFKMSAADKDRVIKALSIPYGEVELLCDGYRVTLNVMLWNTLKYRVMTRVNSTFKGEWVSPKSTAPERKFLRQYKRDFYSPTALKKIEKTYGKRFLKKFVSENQISFLCAAPDWASGRAVISHLCKVCDNIQILDIRYVGISYE